LRAIVAPSGFKALVEEDHPRYYSCIGRQYLSIIFLFSDALSSKWSVNALDFVFTNPVFRNNKFTTNSGIPTASAARFTRVLLEKNLIAAIEEASGRRPALYSFEPLMELVRV
jgi:hypothetical protein